MAGVATPQSSRESSHFPGHPNDKCNQINANRQPAVRMGRPYVRDGRAQCHAGLVFRRWTIVLERRRRLGGTLRRPGPGHGGRRSGHHRRRRRVHPPAGTLQGGKAGRRVRGTSPGIAGTRSPARQTLRSHQHRHSQVRRSAGRGRSRGGDDQRRFDAGRPGHGQDRGRVGCAIGHRSHSAEGAIRGRND